MRLDWKVLSLYAALILFSIISVSLAKYKDRRDKMSLKSVGQEIDELSNMDETVVIE